MLDTSVLVAALSSHRGASFLLLSQVGTGAFDVAVSAPLALEYEDVLIRDLSGVGFKQEDVRDIVDYICRVAVCQQIFFLWRPVLRDPGDDMALELAVAAGCEAIITHNVRDFDRARPFGVRALSPGTFVNELRGAK